MGGGARSRHGAAGRADARLGRGVVRPAGPGCDLRPQAAGGDDPAGTGPALGAEVGTGVFGADMKVHLVNDGPITLILEV